MFSFMKYWRFSLEHLLSYELNLFLPTLFEAKEIFRKSDKSQLACTIEKYIIKESKN